MAGRPRGGPEEEPDDLSVPRSEWLSRVMRKHPDVLELRERFRPLNFATTFARNKMSSKSEVKEILSDDVVDQLILQFLAEQHYDATLQLLEKDWNLKAASATEPDALQTLLRVGVTDPKNIFSPPPESDEYDMEVEAYRSYVYNNEEDEDAYWDEPPDSPDNIKVSNNVIVAGTLNKLVMWLTSSKHDLDFRKAFFLTHHSFVSSECLLTKLIQRYNVPPDKAEQGGSGTDPALVITVLKFWVDNYAYDFNEKLLSSLNNFIDTTLARDGHANWAKQLRGVIAKLEKGTESTGVVGSEQKKEMLVEPKIPKNIFSPTLTLDDIDEEEIARQLCIIDWTLYAAIRPTEFLSKSWTRNKSRAPNLLAFIKRFNCFAKIVAMTIINERRVSGKSRSRSLLRYLRIAEHLRNFNNFFSLCAIFTGIANTAVYNLKGLTRELPKPQLESLHDLERLFNCESSCKNYRIAYNAAKPPCIPFIGVHVRDISIVDDCDPDNIRDMINFAKRFVIWREITTALQYQPIRYPFQTVHQVAVFLNFSKAPGTEYIYDQARELDGEEQ